MTFEIKKHIEIDENYQGINYTEFSFDASYSIENGVIINEFIKSSSFKFDSLRNCIKNEPNKGYLRRAFDFNTIQITDFKKYNKTETIQFLIDFFNEPNWGDDRNDFKKLLDVYVQMSLQLTNDDFYIISKDWFDKEDIRLIEPENWVYSYYFIIITINKDTKFLTLSEWTYD